MKTKIILVVLVVAAVGLAVALFAVKKQSDDQHATDVSVIVDFSNQVAAANIQLNALHDANVALTNDLAASRQQVAASEEQITQLSNRLTAAAATLVSTKTAFQEQITNLNGRITDLEAQNKALDQRAAELTAAIAQLNATIDETRKQLATSETNRKFVEQELQKQLAQKAELERKFNDLEVLRAQVKKIRTEMFVARRLELMKNDNTGKKGAQLLMQHTVTVAPAAVATPAAKPAVNNYDLNVEVGSDGNVRVIPPLGRTNTAAH